MPELFHDAHVRFIEHHTSLRRSESLRRLKEGHGHAEKTFLQQVWWPAFHHFHDLHPEYEIKDFKDGTRFLDFAYLRHTLKLAIEIDGFATHASQISRTQFSDQCLRQNHLILDGWKILRFTYDDVKDRPRMCEQILHQFMGRYLGLADKSNIRMNYIEKEVLRYALTLDRSLTTQDVCHALSIKEQKARQILKIMHEQKMIEPVGKGTKRIRCFRPTADALQLVIG